MIKKMLNKKKNNETKLNHPFIKNLLINVNFLYVIK